MQIIKQQEILGYEFRVYGTADKPLFLAKDVAMVIGYDISNVSKLINNVDEDEKALVQIIREDGSTHKQWFLTEYGLYEVLMQSRKPIAKEFKKGIKIVLEELRKTGSYSTHTYSPQLQLLMSMEIEQQRQAQEQQRQALEIQQTKQQIEVVEKATNQRIDNIKEVIALDSTSWRKDASKIISKIALTFGGFNYIRDVQIGIYELLEQRAGVNLGVRLENKRLRMTRDGICKSKRDKFTKVDIIAEDKKLIEIYVSIIKDLAIKYDVDLSFSA